MPSEWLDAVPAGRTEPTSETQAVPTASALLLRDNVSHTMSLRQSRTEPADGGAAGARIRAFCRVAWPVLVVLGLVVLLSPLVLTA